MQFIAHRGVWSTPQEKNSLRSFASALADGYGIETDFRDLRGRLVISHDPAGDDSIGAEEFVMQCLRNPVSVPHAINIKADGLHNMIRDTFSNWLEDSYFVFDMSIPDTLRYLDMGVPTFVRWSEYETPAPKLLERAKGVWLDSFESEWFNAGFVSELIAAGKSICIVSPELHGRERGYCWSLIKESGFHQNKDLFLCTDHPKQADTYFNHGG